MNCLLIEVFSVYSCRKKGLFWLLKVLTLALSMLMVLTALIGLTEVGGIEESGRIFVAVYMIFFSVLLMMFEISQIRPCENVDFMFKRNFGFLYGTKGKALFIIFVAFLSFGLTEPATLCFATGSLFALLGAFQIAEKYQKQDFERNISRITRL